MFKTKKKNLKNQPCEEVLTRLNKEFEEFLESGRERLVFKVEELPSDIADNYKKGVKLGWRTFQEGHRSYYDFEFLEEKEKELALSGKDYYVVAFARPNAFGQAPYDQPVLESIARVRANNLFLTTFNNSSNLNYHSFASTATKPEFGNIARQLKENNKHNQFFENIEEAKKSYDVNIEKLLSDTKHSS